LETCGERRTDSLLSPKPITGVGAHARATKLARALAHGKDELDKL